MSLKVQKCDMHQKHSVTNYCRQGCYGQGKLGINQNFSRSGKSQGKALLIKKKGKLLEC